MAAVDVGALANVATALTIIVALVFGALQVREHQARRRDEAAVLMISSFQDASFVRAIRIVWRLPVASRARDVSADRETEEAATQVCNALAGVGYAVYRGVVPLEIADETMGTSALVAWTRLERWVAAARRTAGTDDAYHWFEWLVRQVEARRGPQPLRRAEDPPGPR